MLSELISNKSCDEVLAMIIATLANSKQWEFSVLYRQLKSYQEATMHLKGIGHLLLDKLVCPAENLDRPLQDR